MAISQISTSVSILNTGLSGFLGVSLTNYETSALSAIAAGSTVEIGGAFFLCQGETAINASSWTAITTATSAYLALTPSGTAGSQIVTAAWIATAPVWSESKQGWYTSTGSIVRVIGSAYKVSATQQEKKYIFNSRYGWQGKRDVITSPGSGNWTVPGGVSKILVSCVGGGGGGGGGGSSAYGGGGGGGSGAIVAAIEFFTVPGQVFSYTVGAGGAGGPATSASWAMNGENGGTTSFHTFSASAGSGCGTGASGFSFAYNGGAGVSSGGIGFKSDSGSGGHGGGIGGGLGGHASGQVGTPGVSGGGGGGGHQTAAGGAGGSGFIIIEY